MLKTLSLVLSSLVLVADTSITSSILTKRLESGPKLVETDSSYYRNFLKSRVRRSSPLSPDHKRPEVKQFDLANDTTHNQALIHWSGDNSQVVFILTRKKSTSAGNRITESTLWRSSDYGANYVRMNPKFDKETTLKSYFVSPTNKKKVIFVDGYDRSSRLWISVDEGESYSPVTVLFSVEKIEFHPEKSDWLLAYDKFHKTLWCSQDFGKTWKKLHGEVTSERYYWYVKEVDTGENAESIVHFEYRNLKLLPQRLFEVKSCYIPDCRETEFQKEFDALENIDMDSLVVQNEYVFVQKSGAANKLFVSHKRGPFVRARFPYYPGTAQSHFHVISSDGQCVVIGVNHNNGFTHLFISNVQGNTFTQSLSHVRYFNRKTADTRVYTIDIHEVKGVVGTYICNVHQPGPHKYNVTKISWDNCRTWSNITEVYEQDGKKMTGCDGCHLNLHLSMDQTKSGYYIPNIVTKKTVPGLIIAHGVFSHNIQDNPNEVIMFTSKDNGKTWYKARQKRHLAVVSDHGAILVAIEMIFLQPVTTLDFSSDYGRTWKTYQFTTQSVNVDGILTEPGENTHYLTLFGHKTYADSWRIFRLNMQPVLDKVCVYPDDFENITLPTQISGDTCHLGLKQQAERKKPHVDCLIETTYKRLTYEKQCQCTMEDYDCDLGYRRRREKCEYERNMENAIDDIDLPDWYFPTVRGGEKCIDGYKNVSTGFRRIPGDKCLNELYDQLWQIQPCTSPAFTTTPTATTTPGQKLELQLLNKTAAARMSQTLIFSIVNNFQEKEEKVVWHIVRPISEPKMLVKPPKDNLTLFPERPGRYTVQVSRQSTHSEYSNMINVDFWYAIEKIYLYHPPAVAKNKTYNATVFLGTKYGLRGNKSLLGDVMYSWDMEKTVTESRNNTMLDLRHSETTEIRVTAMNLVSLLSTSGSVQVREFIETLILELKVDPELERDTYTSDVWLSELKTELKLGIYTLKNVQQVLKEYKLHDGINVFMYLPPAFPLKAYIYIIPKPKEKNVELVGELLEAVVNMEHAIANSDVKIDIAGDTTITIGNQYIIDHDGKITKFTPFTGHDSNPVVTAVVVIAVGLFFLAFILVLRKLGGRFRFERRLPGVRASSSGSTSIVRNLDTDTDPILENEFYEEGLETMQAIGNQDCDLEIRRDQI